MISAITTGWMRGETMAGPAPTHPGADGGQSVGELVSLAVRDLTRLFRFEVDLAKLELKADARRLGLAGALLSIAAFAGCLVLVLLCFALAYGLITVGIWPWAAFLIVAGVCVVLAAVAGTVVTLKVRRVSGLRKTRETVHDDIALLRRDGQPASTAVTVKTG
jgi:uncharacterized membrane protein YqjE